MRRPVSASREAPCVGRPRENESCSGRQAHLTLLSPLRLAMDKRVSFVIPQTAAAAIDIQTFRASVHRMRLGGRVTTARRGAGQYVKCSRPAAKYLISLLLERAVAVGTTSQLLIECSCAVQAIYEVYDPRVLAHSLNAAQDQATRAVGPPREAIRIVGGSCDGLHLVWDSDMTPVYLDNAGRQVPSRCPQGIDETYSHTFVITIDAIEKVLSFVTSRSRAMA
jgi:hypothetical protein